MLNREHQRRHKRYTMDLRAALVVDRMGEFPIIYTQIQDLSIGGAAVFSEHGDLEGADVTVLLALSQQAGSEQSNTITVRAKVASTVHVPAKGAYRLGLKFLHASDLELKALAKELHAAEIRAKAAIPAAQEAPPAAPAPAATPVGGGRLAALRQLAQTKREEKSAEDTQQEINQRVDAALRRTFAYLKELVEHLNVVRPAFARSYPLLVGVPPLDGLAWDGGQVDFREKEMSKTWKRCEEVRLRLRLDGKKYIEATRDNPVHEKLERALSEHAIEYTKREFRNARGTLERTTYRFPCAVVARLVMVGNYQTGVIELTTRHVRHFGTLEYKLNPEGVTEESLEELTSFILGETATIGSLLRQV